MLERVIEERARGDLTAAAAIRAEVTRLVGDDLAKLKPGSPEAAHLKQVLIEQNAWSQYLESALDRTRRSSPRPADGGRRHVHGRRRASGLLLEQSGTGSCAGRGVHRPIVGATLGNDVNLRDVEGRSALLLSKAKDNNASCAIGPFVRLFDDAFTWMIFARRR